MYGNQIDITDFKLDILTAGYIDSHLIPHYNLQADSWGLASHRLPVENPELALYPDITLDDRK